MRAVVDAILPSDGRGKFRFEVPCPTTFAAVTVQTPNEQIKVGAKALVPVSAKPSMRVGERLVGEEVLAIQILGKALACPTYQLCPATVRLDSGKSATYLFPGESASSSTLIVDDSRLAKQLRETARATIERPLPGGGVRSLTLVKRNSNEWTIVAGNSRPMSRDPKVSEPTTPELAWPFGAFTRIWA